MRQANITRQTNETSIRCALNIDNQSSISIQTGIPFFDHMLHLFAFHGNFELNLDAKGDIEIDDHHTVEDVGIVLGQAFKEALGDKLGIHRYGVAYVPMDESLSRVVIDISNRPFCVLNATFRQPQCGTFSTQNVKEFFIAFANASGITIHVTNLAGENDHHIIESIFKAFGRALNEAVKIQGQRVASTKGML